MGENFFTAWQDGVTGYEASNMNPPLQDLDKAITHMKNVVIHCDGSVTYRKSNGRLTWSDTLRIHFNNDDGDAVVNTVAATYATLSDNQFAYVDLNQTTGTVITVSVATITAGAASNFIAFNRLVLGYRNTASDDYFPVYLHLTDPLKVVQTLTPGDSITVDWSKGLTARVVLNRLTTTFAFEGARDGDKCILVCEQDGTGSRAVAFGAEVRAGTDISSPPTLSAANLKDYLMYIYDGEDSKYDFVYLVKGF